MLVEARVLSRSGSLSCGAGAEPLPTLPSDGTMSQMPVVVGYNGKKHASEALDWAAEEALHRAAALIVLFAANYPGMTLPPGPGLFELEPGALDAATEVTDIGVAQVRTAYPDLIAIGRTVVTSPTEALVEESAEASLLVVGLLGRGSLLATLLGSISFAVASTAQCPVVVVKDGCAAAVAPPEACRRWDGRLGTSSVCCGIRRRFRREPLRINGADLLHRRTLGAGGQPRSATPHCCGHPGAHLCVVERSASATDRHDPPRGRSAGTDSDRRFDRRRSHGCRVKWQRPPSNDDFRLDSIRSRPRRPVPGGSRLRGVGDLTRARGI
jgi:nucleotide-binding universal stress UspA family protein